MAGLESLQGSPEITPHEFVKVNFKLKWRSQDPGNENQHVISTKRSCAGEPDQERGHVCCRKNGVHMVLS